MTFVFDRGCSGNSIETSASGSMCFHREEQRSFVAADLSSFLSDNSHISKCGDTEAEKSETSPGIIISTVKTPIFDNVAATGPTRSVFRCWPWPATAGPICFEQALCGKRTPNGLLWGATVFDCYSVQKVPNIWTISMGSTLLDRTEQSGEDYAMDEIEWAKREKAPHVVEPCPHGTFLENQEQNIRSRAAGWGTPNADTK